MNILYCRVSTIGQNTDRQMINKSEYQRVIEDKCSGTIPFFERDGGHKVKLLVDEGKLTKLVVHDIDRLGRDLRDILNTLHYFNERRICVRFVAKGLDTLDANGDENPVAKLMISVLGIVGEMERKQIRERQLEGIAVAKIKGAYKGRKEGTTESDDDFLTKPKCKDAAEYLRKGYSGVDVATLTGLNLNTVYKVKRILKAQSL